MRDACPPAFGRRGFAAMAAALLPASAARAQEWPARPIRMIVPGTGGGGMDVIARVIADRMGSILGQPFVVENRAGAGGNIAVDAVAKAAPDGYTVLLGQTAHFAINPSLYARLPFDTQRDFIPVVQLADAPNVVVVGEGSRHRTLQDVVAEARRTPEGLHLATPGNGTVSHLTGELFQGVAGIRFTHVPYRGAAAAVTDVIAGRVPLMMSSVPTALSNIRDGRLRAIAVSAARRSPVLPDIPTIGEQGFPGFDANTWYGLFVPAGTPAAVVQRLNTAANDALRAPGVADRVRQEGGDIVGGTAEAFARMVVADAAKWSRVVQESGARAD
ncbi:tripartite tricarboxylate transporter substrate binding protein [Falsiroseomonas stagni]|uniref:Tripartite-type tricarboxylate transporter, receptor component TctC n=1 Tax=Falsiroseomonas stagni DSM 19981 TaxID=1123062 RepID=A0A1I4B856_9PROT|nr:tripartite tricarboxylate transporter substrate binding protein [Falsiroseomonas stagni]SFK64520.1 Tripartite-type tricarboxylate transporter, receptor component TctC [Falsiroseomonas stagni DSM 19981]